MDWTQTDSLIAAKLDQLLGKATDPAAVLAALERKIAAAVTAVEGRIEQLDARSLELPALIETARAAVTKLDAVVARAESDGRADLKAAALGRRVAADGQRIALEAEQAGIDAERDKAEDAVAALQEKQLDLEEWGRKVAEGRVVKASPSPKPSPSASASASPSASASAKASASPRPAPAPKAAAKPAAPVKKADALDDEFAALMSEMNIDLNAVELPKKKKAASVIEIDDKLPEMVEVADDELPEGEELPPLKGMPAAKAASGKLAAPAKTAAPVKAPATAKAAPAAAGKAAPPAAKKSRKWVWWAVGTTTLAGGGAALAHFLLHLF